MPDPFKDAPQTMRKRLATFGGLNPYGLPNWRVCLAQHCTQISGGIFRTMPGGELSIVEEELLRDGSVRLHHRAVNPEKVEHSSFMVTPKYPHEGWILELWMPAHLWGSRDWWEGQKAEDGLTPLMGPYPERGDYWMLAGPWERAPETSDVETAIAQYRQAQANRPHNLETHLKQQLKEQEERKLADREKRAQAYIERIEKDIVPLMRSTSLSAQRLRDQVMAELGQQGHLTSGEF